MQVCVFEPTVATEDDENTTTELEEDKLDEEIAMPLEDARELEDELDIVLEELDDATATTLSITTCPRFAA